MAVMKRFVMFLNLMSLSLLIVAIWTALGGLDFDYSSGSWYARLRPQDQRLVVQWIGTSPTAADRAWSFMGIDYTASGAAGVVIREWRIPLLWLFVVGSLVPIWRLVRFFRPNPRELPGHCSACGYDLRASLSGKCPECGTPIPVGTSARH